MKTHLAHISPLEKKDVTSITTLARIIWLRQYQDILVDTQIYYMLAQRYCPLLIRVQLDQNDVWWRKLVSGDMTIGFLCCMRTTVSDELKIDKLYIHHDHHRKGYGKMLVDEAVRIMHKIGCHTLMLTVNKQNNTAIHAYQRYGFRITGDSVVDIGCGFFMNDHLMVMTSNHSA